MHVRNYKMRSLLQSKFISKTYSSIPDSSFPEFVEINEELFNTDAISSSKGLNALFNIIVQRKFSLT